MTGSQKRKLKSLAHKLKPIVLIGQKGITESLVKAVDKALEDHELIKVKFIDLKDEKVELAAKVVSDTKSFLVNMIGNTAIIYRENPERPKEDKIKI
ncbi:MAG: ribosome assembly RNA-binding protein YhbY [Spirochaetae bacterium HGW-Spirochaetae-5]|nr:MAG: ribosome assembly RNA-binding protein YhbY [Spirochaetae bacterium HGW-Spirochaetae-5]